MRTGSTYTDHFRIEGRQHELFGVDLGEGYPRGAILFAFVAYVVWCLPIFLLAGLPGPNFLSLYIVPPGIVTMLGYRMSPNDRRRNIAVWIIRARYRVFGHRPVICGGRRAASRSEWLPRSHRRRSADVDELAELVHAAGPPIVHDARPRLYGPDYLFKITQNHKAVQK